MEFRENRPAIRNGPNKMNHEPSKAYCMPSDATDTSAEAATVQLSVLRQLGPARRSELAAEWSEDMRQLAMQGIRDRHPDYSERRVVLEYARLTLGEKLFQEAFASEAAELA